MINIVREKIFKNFKDIWNIRVAKLRLAVQTVEKNRVETEMPDHGGLYEVSDYTQLGKYKKSTEFNKIYF